MADFEDFFHTAQDGLRLHARLYGGRAAGALPVVCLAGLTRNARDFHALALHLSQDAATRRQVVAFDYRGRGESARDPDWRNYNVAVEAADIRAGLTALGIGEAAFIGTSRGGLIILVLAALAPGLIRAAVLNDVGPVIEGAGLAEIRAHLEKPFEPADIAEAAVRAKASQGAAFPALTGDDWLRAARAFWREENGRLVPDYDPALLNTLAGIDFSKPLPALWPQFEALSAIPLLAIRGGNSTLLSQETLAAMAQRHGAMQAITVDGQGHAPLLETAGLPMRIAAFLDEADRTR